LGAAMVLVILVVYLFLQSWRTTLIPGVAVPVSLIGTFAGMQALGFSINTLTLFGMVLAIGMVVDDAIVVVENVERHMKEECCSSKEAAKRAMDEVTGPVIAIVLVLCSVFVPVGFLGGITGELYKQFAITIAMSVTISGLVALTLSPALCALVLKPGGEGQSKGFFTLFNKFFDWTRDRYTAVAGLVINRAALALVVFGVVIALGIGLFRLIPSSFLPDEDQGYFITMLQLPDGASKQRTDAVLSKVERYFLSIPAIHSTDAMSGLNFVFNTRGPNSATMFLPLHHWDRRGPHEHVKALIGAAYGEFAKIPEALILAFNAPSIRGLGTTAGFSVQLQDPSGGDFKKFAAVAQAFVAKARQDPAIGAIGTSFRVSSPRLYAHVNRE
ncbi:MAG: efflux RND transporter permease subunit, partial [Nitrospiraceae bacterium]